MTATKGSTVVVKEGPNTSGVVRREHSKDLPFILSFSSVFQIGGGRGEAKQAKYMVISQSNVCTALSFAYCVYICYMRKHAWEIWDGEEND